MSLQSCMLRIAEADVSSEDWLPSLLCDLHATVGNNGACPIPLLNLLLRERLGDALLQALVRYLMRSFAAWEMEVQKQSLSQRDGLQRTLAAFCALGWPQLYQSQYALALRLLIQERVAREEEEEEGEGSEEEEEEGKNGVERIGQGAQGAESKEGQSMGGMGGREGAALQRWVSGPLREYGSLLLGPLSAPLRAELQLTAVSLLASKSSASLFEMVAEYPDSLPALTQLRDRVAASGSLGPTGRQFRTQMRRRLLHSGASTAQILDFYVSAVKALRVLDPSDLMLSFAAAPIRAYLKGRKDAVRCIVASLTEGRDSDLHRYAYVIRYTPCSSPNIPY
ncbi:hypothetical protein B484DRAFT_195436 [Ochromonadaceae sp. CCMP2298]|nr:hypothetical protein B484DRAFT_195436 [Ochromonadaceae sp. CCMP2298]